MPGSANDWNVVVRGAWNLAILTPAGIAHRLFGLEPGTPIEVHVAVDRPSIARVIHQGIAVMPSPEQIIVAPLVELTSETIETAAGLATRAVKQLPETPLAAVGVNIKFRFEVLSDEMTEFLSSTLDDKLSDDGLNGYGRSLQRSVVWDAGRLNIQVDELNDSSGMLTFNFHRDSVKPEEHVAWLAKCRDMVTEAQRIGQWFGTN